jgi:hypothetical protein
LAAADVSYNSQVWLPILERKLEIATEGSRVTTTSAARPVRVTTEPPGRVKSHLFLILFSLSPLSLQDYWNPTYLIQL